MTRRVLQPAGWPRPQGYANGIEATGRMVFVAGQVGWDEEGRFVAGDFVAQTRQALANVLRVLAEAGLGPEHVVRMTWYVTDIHAYRQARKALSAVWRELMGRHFPAMTLVAVTALVEPEALVEIEATAVG
ncbi:2-iminobutanoate/2-iminopropanoate deaminase [bacterium HR40]|nr:2-iminobutanoate/2-iminopropanoate deaminase [bacterium HR40]